MKLLEKFVLIIYSLLMLVISSITCLLIFKVLTVDQIINWINYALNDTSITIILLSVSVLFILLSVRCIFYRKRKQIKKSDESEILLENDAGRLLISKRAIENCIKNVITEDIKSNPDIKITVDIDPASNISTYISVVLDKNVKVRDFTVDLQSKIKDRVKESFDLDIKQINIKIDSSEKVEIKKEIQKKSEENKALQDINNELIEVKPKEDEE